MGWKGTLSEPNPGGLDEVRLREGLSSRRTAVRSQPVESYAAERERPWAPLLLQPSGLLLLGSSRLNPTGWHMWQGSLGHVLCKKTDHSRAGREIGQMTSKSSQGYNSRPNPPGGHFCFLFCFFFTFEVLFCPDFSALDEGISRSVIPSDLATPWILEGLAISGHLRARDRTRTPASLLISLAA